jgi:hypothetical protein
MSFIDTIALPLFIAIIGLVALITAVAWGYSMATEARATMLARKRDSRLERQAYEFLGKLYIETNSTTSDVTLSPELSDDLWKLVDRIDQTKELTR